MKRALRQFAERKIEVEKAYASSRQEVVQDYTALKEAENREQLFLETEEKFIPARSIMGRILSILHLADRLRCRKQYNKKPAKKHSNLPQWLEKISNRWESSTPWLELGYKIGQPVLLSAGITAGQSIFKKALFQLNPFKTKRKKRK